MNFMETFRMESLKAKAYTFGAMVIFMKEDSQEVEKRGQGTGDQRMNSMLDSGEQGNQTDMGF